MENEDLVMTNTPDDIPAADAAPPAEDSISQVPESVPEDIPELADLPGQDIHPEPDSGQEPGDLPELDGVQDKPAEEKPTKLPFRRACGKWTDIFLIAAALSVLLIIAGQYLNAVVYKVFPLEAWFNSVVPDEAVQVFLRQYFDFFGIWIVFIILITVFRSNWPMWKAFFYNFHGNNLKAILAGILLGGGMNGFCILMSYLSGDIKLSFNEFNPRLFFLFLLCVMIQSGAEEIVDRCYLYQKLRRRYRWPVIAVVVNSLVFAALHLANPGVTWLGILQVFEIGVLFSLIVYYYDSLWTAIWAHTAWNFSQSIVFGLPNSGIVSAYSVFKLDAASARNGIFYNTGFGVEGSVGANVMIAVVSLIILLTGVISRRGEKADHWKKREEAALAGKDQGAAKVFWAVVGWGLWIAFIAATGLLLYKYYKPQ